MKTTIKLLALAFVLFATACSNDDEYDMLNSLWRNVTQNEARIDALEKWCAQVNTNISSLQTIVNVLESNGTVTSITPVMEGGVEIGYTITFSNHDPITIYHGKDGKDGQNGANGQNGTSPIVGVAKYTDGVYYWTLNGEWLLDANGNKLPVSGKDGVNGENGQNGSNGQNGVTPQLKIENDYWWISYDNGSTWTQLGKAKGEDGENGQNGAKGDKGDTGDKGDKGDKGDAGDSMFQSVTQDADNVYFTLTNGTVITIAKGDDAPSEDDIIVFKDLAVKSALLNYKPAIDTNADGEITYKEAAAFNGSLKITGNTNIYSFKEFQHFTAATSCSFSGSTNLFEIVLPENIDSIISFSKTKIRNMKITKGVEYIKESCFSNCTSLEKVVFEEGCSVSILRNYTFSSCSSLRFFEHSDINTIDSIGAGVFSGTKLIKFTTPENFKGDKTMFQNSLPDTLIWNTIDSNLNFYSYRSSPTGVGSNSISYYYYGLADCGGQGFLHSYTKDVCVFFGEQVQTIPAYICAGLTGLSKIEIPNSVTIIPQRAFYNTGLTSVNIPSGVNTIDYCAFEHCTSLESVIIEGNPYISSSAFYDCTKLYYLYCHSLEPPVLASSSVFPSSLKIIYVPKDAVEDYRVIWSDYASKIIGYDF